MTFDLNQVVNKDALGIRDFVGPVLYPVLTPVVGPVGVKIVEKQLLKLDEGKWCWHEAFWGKELLESYQFTIFRFIAFLGSEHYVV